MKSLAPNAPEMKLCHGHVTEYMKKIYAMVGLEMYQQYVLHIVHNLLPPKKQLNFEMVIRCPVM